MKAVRWHQSQTAVTKPTFSESNYLQKVGKSCRIYGQISYLCSHKAGGLK